MNHQPATIDRRVQASGTSTPETERDIRVLCVDDEPSVVEMTASFMMRESDHITTITVTSAADGIERLETEEIDCVVSDYQMPDMDGLDLLDRVRTEHGDLPFVLFTGAGSEEIASEAISRGVTDYLRKEPGTDQYAILANRVENLVEQYRTKRRLEREQTRQSALFENTPDPIVEVTFEDGTPIIDNVNSAFEDLFGFDSDAVVGQDIGALLVSDSERDEYLSLREQVFQGVPVEAEVRRQTVDEVRDFKLRVIPIDVTDISGGAYGWYTDITELKERERQLRESEQQFRSLVEGVEEYAIFLLDLEGRVVTWNEGAERIKGYTEAGIVGEHFSAFYPEDVPRESLDRKLARAAHEGGIEDEGWRVRKDGTRFWASATITAIRDADGELAGFSKVTRDMTERRECEEALRRERDLVERIVQTSPVGIGVLSPSGELLRTNDRAAEIVGASRETVGEYRIGDLPVYDERGERIPSDETAFARVLETGEPVLGQTVQIEGYDGERRWLSVNTASLTDEAGTLEAVVVVTKDVTELKERELELERQNERLEEFVGVVSHDLRNPLLVAKGSLELARESDTQEDFDRLDSALERMTALIDDLLTLARKGQRVEETRPVALDALVRSTWVGIPNDRATLDVEPGDYRVEADETRLRQLLENLLSNAVEHGSTSRQASPDDAVEHGGDDVTVRVGLLEDGDGFYVADDGPGIPPDHREKIFERGYSTSSEGTGFGLSIIRGIAEAHGWTVTASESTDGGARFDVVVGEPGQVSTQAERSPTRE